MKASINFPKREKKTPVASTTAAAAHRFIKCYFHWGNIEIKRETIIFFLIFSFRCKSNRDELELHDFLTNSRIARIVGGLD